MLSIRPAAPGDSAQLLRLAAEGRWEELSPAVRQLVAPEEPAAWGQCLLPGAGRRQLGVFVLEAEAGLVGYGAACVLSAGLAGVRQGQLLHLYVRPGWRRFGGGTALARAGEDWLRSRGCPDVTAVVPLHQPEAVALARRLGYSGERWITALPLT